LNADLVAADQVAADDHRRGAEVETAAMVAAAQVVLDEVARDHRPDADRHAGATVRPVVANDVAGDLGRAAAGAADEDPAAARYTVAGVEVLPVVVALDEVVSDRDLARV